MNTVLIIAVLSLGQTQMPSEFDRSLFTLREMENGDRVRVHPNAIGVDERGGTWVKGSFVAGGNGKYDRYKPIEVIKTNMGYIVKIHPMWKRVNGYAVPYYPQWSRLYAKRYYDKPVKAIVKVDPPRPKYTSAQLRAFQGALIQTMRMQEVERRRRLYEYQHRSPGDSAYPPRSLQ